MLPELTAEEFSAALDTTAIEALLALGADGPPVDAVTLAHKLDITVALDAGQPQRARYVRLGRRGGGPGRSTILLRPDPRPEREQWAVAHEIGEHLAQRVFELLSVDPREAVPQSREMVANRLAARLLLPAHWFAREARSCGWDLPRLKARFTTASHELIARRMLDFAPPVLVTIFDHGGLTFRGGNLPGRLPELAPLELACQRRAHESGRAERRGRGAVQVVAWPIHEPDWKREILRTTVDPFWEALDD